MNKSTFNDKREKTSFTLEQAAIEVMANRKAFSVNSLYQKMADDQKKRIMRSIKR